MGQPYLDALLGRNLKCKLTLEKILLSTNIRLNRLRTFCGYFIVKNTGDFNWKLFHLIRYD